MKQIEVTVDIDDILDEIDTDDLLKELGKSKGVAPADDGAPTWLNDRVVSLLERGEDGLAIMEIRDFLIAKEKGVV